MLRDGQEISGTGGLTQRSNRFRFPLTLFQQRRGFRAHGGEGQARDRGGEASRHPGQRVKDAQTQAGQLRETVSEQPHLPAAHGPGPGLLPAVPLRRLRRQRRGVQGVRPVRRPLGQPLGGLRELHPDVRRRGLLARDVEHLLHSGAPADVLLPHPPGRRSAPAQPDVGLPAPLRAVRRLSAALPVLGHRRRALPASPVRHGLVELVPGRLGDPHGRHHRQPGRVPSAGGRRGGLEGHAAGARSSSSRR